jgi:hypothetical protein
MTNSDFMDWKRHPVTQQVFSQLQERVAELVEALVQNAGIDPITDSMNSGAIKAYRDLLTISYEEETQ